MRDGLTWMVGVACVLLLTVGLCGPGCVARSAGTVEMKHVTLGPHAELWLQVRDARAEAPKTLSDVGTPTLSVAAAPASTANATASHVPMGRAVATEAAPAQSVTP